MAALARWPCGLGGRGPALGGGTFLLGGGRGRRWEVQHRSARTLRQAHPTVAAVQPPSMPRRGGRELRPQEQRKWALITLSGQTFVSSRNDVWHGIADVMGRVNANIEDAAGTSMRCPVPESADITAGCHTGNPSFLVSAFDTHITPFSMSFARSSLDESPEDSHAVAILLKASIAESMVPLMTNLLHTRFPGLVCTVTIGGATEPEEAVPMQQRPQKVLTGTVRLFGIDEVGQLARIAEALHRCHVTILNLIVTTGICDFETGEFIERGHGTLAENVLTIAIFDRAVFNEAALRREVEATARDNGYKVTSIILDGQESRSQELAGYYLERKAFMSELKPA